MIQGIHCDVPAAELKTLLDERVAHHAEKLAFYIKSADDLEKQGLRENNNSSIDPIRGIKDKIASHASNRDFLVFVRDHLVVTETYRLSEHDLQRLGLISSARY